MNNEFKIFIVYHKIINEERIFPNYSKEYISKHFAYYGVNEIFKKRIPSNICENILEYELSVYNPFLQQRSYMETSAYLHIYLNSLHKGLKFVGICQYDMIHTTLYNNLKEDTIYFMNTNSSTVTNGCYSRFLCPDVRNIDFLIENYNTFFKTSIRKSDLSNIPLSLWQTNIYPVKIFEKLCSWLLKLVEEIYPWSAKYPYETHWGSIGGYTERAIGIFNSMQIFEKTKYENLSLIHEGYLEKGQYNKKYFLNNFETDIYTKYVENITNKDIYDKLRFTMFTSLCYNNEKQLYSCERIKVNDTNGLLLKYNNNSKIYGFEIEAEDPRLVIIKNKVYVIFTCISTYKHMKRGIAITPFDDFKPTLLKIRNDVMNTVEKNWAPFVKNDELFFVYNYDPLVIIKYDFNTDGYCDIIFSQNNVQLPIETNEGCFLRGGSNLIHYKDNLFIGGCHSRIHYKGIYYNTHIIILDTLNWSIIYLTKPILYNYHHSDLGTIANTNILWHISPLPYHSSSSHMIQAPCSINKIDSKYVITVDVNCHISLLYELKIDICSDNYRVYNMGELQQKTLEYNTNLIDSL